MRATAGSSPPPFLQLLAHGLRWKIVSALAWSDRQVQELQQIVDEPQNTVSYHLRRLRSSHLVHERRSSADGRDVYYSLDLDRLAMLYASVGKALHPALDPGSEQVERPTSGGSSRVRVLFLCTHNSARSQMAEGIMRHAGGDRVEVFSAGSEPTSVRQEAICAMADLGIDIAGARARHPDTLQHEDFDWIITVCDRVREVCPVFPGDPERIHWSLPDPTLVDDPQERQHSFTATARELSTRIGFLLTLIDRESGS